MILVLFTNSYPYDFSAEHIFLAHETPYLAKNIDRVILVPRISKGRLLSIPSPLEVDDSYSAYFKKNTNILSILLNAFGSTHFYEEIHARLFLLLNPVKLAKLILSMGRAEVTRKWMTEWIETHQVDTEQIMLYSYWFDDVAVGLGLVKQKYPHIKIVSRAHGYDIYEELYFPYYWPLRRKTLSQMDRLFPASYDGRDYFCGHYPEFRDLFETCHLGIEEPGFVSKPSADGVLRIVSCAYIVALKRIDLLLEGIACAARIRPEQKFEWLHFGDGRSRKKLQRAMREKFTHNVMGNLPGHVQNQDIMRYYKENTVDVFVNLSTTEGGAPVSIMEAISCGIPIIATKVGGNPEIVSERNGILLKPNPTPQEIAHALLKMCDNPGMNCRMRVESRKVWRESYNADVNYQGFAEKLKTIRQG